MKDSQNQQVCCLLNCNFPIKSMWVSCFCLGFFASWECLRESWKPSSKGKNGVASFLLQQILLAENPGPLSPYSGIPNGVGRFWHCREKCKIALFLGSVTADPVITHKRDRSIEGWQRELNLWHADPAWGSWCQRWAHPEPSSMAKSHLVGFESICFLALRGAVLLAERALGCAGCCNKAGQYGKVQNWVQGMPSAETRLCLTPCRESSEVLKLSILSSRYFPASCHLYAHSTYRGVF